MRESPPPVSGKPSSGSAIWILREGRTRAVLEPSQVSLPKVAAAIHLRKKAFEVVQAWEESNGLLDCFTPGHEAVWWITVRNRFVLELADVFLLLEALQALRLQDQDAPQQVMVQASESSRGTYAAAFKLLFPQCRIQFKKNGPGLRLVSALVRLAGRLRKKTGWARLKKIRGKSRPRVLIFNTEAHWLGGRDKDMGSIDRELRARGVEVITMASSGMSLREKWAGLVLRPRDHLFSDVIGLEKAELRGEVRLVERNRFRCDGIDFSPFVAGYVQGLASWDFAALDRRWADLLGRIAPDYLLLAHGHYDGGALPRAAQRAGVKYCVVQHGRITPYHALYVFPPVAARTYPIPHKIFVYSQEEAEILTRRSIFAPETVAAAGSSEWDPLLEIPGVRERSDSPAGPGSQGLNWLFTSQPGLLESIMRDLMTSAVQSEPRVNVRIRLHPREKSIWLWRKMLREAGLEAEIVQTTPLEDDLRWCAVHLGYSSTCITHAVIANRPSILLGPMDDPWRDQIIAEGLALEAGNPAAVLAAARFWASSAGQAEFSEKRQSFLKKWGIELQPSGKNIADVLYPPV